MIKKPFNLLLSISTSAVLFGCQPNVGNTSTNTNNNPSSEAITPRAESDTISSNTQTNVKSDTTTITVPVTSTPQAKASPTSSTSYNDDYNTINPANNEEILDLSRSNVTLEDILQLNTSNTTELSLKGNTQLTTQQLVDLITSKHFPKLKTLNVSNTNIRYTEIKEIINCSTTIKSLYMEHLTEDQRGNLHYDYYDRGLTVYLQD